MNTPIYADLDQIVFDGRSKEYGAYQMRQRYNRVLTRATLIACLLFISITGLPKMIKWVMPAEIVVADPEEKIIEFDATPVDIPPKPEDEVKVPEPAAPEPPVTTRAFLVPTPTPDELVADSTTIASVVDLDTAAIGLVDHDGEGSDPFASIGEGKPCPTCPDGDGTQVLPDEPEVKPTDFILLEKEPQAVNLDELKKVIGYPPLAKEGEIQGKVVLRVMVDKNGDYVKHIVLDNPHPILTRAVESKISMLKMTPGIQAGKPIKVWVTLPFKFTLMN
jgi:periplasmic protein TonB